MFDTGFETYDINEVLDLIDRIIDIIRKLFGSFLGGGSDTTTTETTTVSNDIA